MVSDISALFTLKIVSFENFNTINLRMTGGGGACSLILIKFSLFFY